MTSPARTLLDLAGCLDVVDLAIAVESAWRKGLALREVEDVLRREGRGRAGAKKLRRVVADVRTRERPLDSALEVKVWWLLKGSRLPLPRPGVEWADDEGPPGRLDFAYREERIAVEVDGVDPHLPAFERDRVRWSRLGAAGWRLIVITADQLKHPEAVLQRIANGLAWRPGSGLEIREQFIADDPFATAS